MGLCPTGPVAGARYPPPPGAALETSTVVPPGPGTRGRTRDHGPTIGPVGPWRAGATARVLGTPAVVHALVVRGRTPPLAPEGGRPACAAVAGCSSGSRSQITDRLEGARLVPWAKRGEPTASVRPMASGPQPVAAAVETVGARRKPPFSPHPRRGRTGVGPADAIREPRDRCAEETNLPPRFEARGSRGQAEQRDLITLPKLNLRTETRGDPHDQDPHTASVAGRKETTS